MTLSLKVTLRLPAGADTFAAVVVLALALATDGASGAFEAFLWVLEILGLSFPVEPWRLMAGLTGALSLDFLGGLPFGGEELVRPRLIAVDSGSMDSTTSLSSLLPLDTEG